MKRLAGKTAIVTGGAQGLGAAIAERYLAEGAQVLIADLNATKVTQTANDLGRQCFGRPVDVTSEIEVARLIDQAIDAFGHLDIMVNNAGILGPMGSILDIEVEYWDRTIAVHLRGTFLGIKHAARVMKDAGSGGVILNTASTAGVRGGLGPHTYTAAKAAIIGLTQSVATELVRDNIRVNSIAPGSHLTPLVAAVLTGDPENLSLAETIMIERSPQGKAAFPKDIAGAYVYLASDESWFANGACLVLDGAREVLANISVSNRS